MSSRHVSAIGSVRPRFPSFANHRVLMAVREFEVREMPLRCDSSSKIRSGSPSTLSRLLLRFRTLPVSSPAPIGVSPANASAGRLVIELLERSRVRILMPWNSLLGRVVSELSEKSKWFAFTRYARSSAWSDVSRSDGGSVLSGLSLNGFSSVVTTRSLMLSTDTVCAPEVAEHGCRAVTSAGVAVTPCALTSFCKCLMISFATA